MKSILLENYLVLNSFIFKTSKRSYRLDNDISIRYWLLLRKWYRWTWIWRTTVRQIFAYDRGYAWSQSDAYQVFIICIRQILHMTDQFSWSHWVRHIQVHLYIEINKTLKYLNKWKKFYGAPYNYIQQIQCRNRILIYIKSKKIDKCSYL